MPHDFLKGIRVLDLSQTSGGAFCSKLLAQDGADVVKVESPDRGSAQRSEGPFLEDRAGVERSLSFWFFGLNQRSVTLDIESKRGKRLLRDLMKSADILIETLSPNKAKSIGLRHENVAKINPRLVHVSLTPFGQNGPYSNYAADGMILDALGGTMYLRGEPDKPPLKMGGIVVDAAGGLAAYIGSLTAVYQRLSVGLGQHVDVSNQEAVFSLAESYSSYYLYMGVVTRRSFDQAFLLPGRIKCKDGDAVPFFYGEAGWENFCLFLHRPDLAKDPRFRTFAARVSHAKELTAEVEALLGSETRRGLVARAQEWGLPFGYVAAINDALEGEGNKARGFIRETQHPLYGVFRYPGSPIRLDGKPLTLDKPPPRLGEHTTQVLYEWLKTE